MNWIRKDKKIELSDEEQKELFGGYIKIEIPSDVSNTNDGGGCTCEYNNSSAILNINKGDCSCVCN